jgi:hypothetical protein
MGRAQVITFERTYPRYHGHVIRPYNEAESLVIQVMYACAHGKCIFCGSYMGKAFRLRPLEYIREDIHGVDAGIRDNVTRVFLSDGDVLTLPLTRMLDILDTLKAQFPSLKRVSAYATPHSLLPLSVDELREMREHGLELLYVGLESGDDVTLALSGRGLSAAQQVRAFTKLGQAGIALSVTAILGLGGREIYPARPLHRPGADRRGPAVHRRDLTHARAGHAPRRGRARRPVRTARCRRPAAGAKGDGERDSCDAGGAPHQPRTRLSGCHRHAARRPGSDLGHYRRDAVARRPAAATAGGPQRAVARFLPKGGLAKCHPR